ncbi:MAG: ATP-binding protein [Bacteroidota bacterium]|nr:ATP-binding protein [Bacteroidota bacterium]
MKNIQKKIEVPVSKLRWRFDISKLKFNSFEEILPSKEIIGQERALRALRLGLEMKHFGYNVFVAGFSGTGRTTTIKRLLKEFEAKKTDLSDFCYLHNFDNPDQPILVQIKAGEGSALKKEMADFLDDMLRDIPAVFESKRYQEERKRILEHFQSRQRTVLKEFEKKVKAKGFEVVQVQVGTTMRPDVVPVINDVSVNFEQIDTMIQQGEITRERVEELYHGRRNLESQMEIIMREMRNIERKLNESIDELGVKSVLPIVREHVDKICKKFSCDKLFGFMENLEENILSNLNRFNPHPPSQPVMPGDQSPPEEDEFIEFRVNVIVDNSKTEGAPIIIETNPRYKNIFGTIEREVDKNGVWRSNFTMIKAGSLLKANGGYLILNALDTLIEPSVWQTLKRTLRNQHLEIQSVETGVFGATSALKPQPIKLDVKVVMIGDAYIYSVLYDADDDFKKIFKVRADFDVVMEKNKSSINNYLNFIKMISDEEKLKALDKSAICEVIEYGVRLAGRQKKLSTRFNLVADVLRESNYWAMKDKTERITVKHVRKALDEKAFRLKMIEEKIQEMILDGTILIDSKGSVVGQVNGLSVYDFGEYAFGKPSRITVTTAMGKAGVINIEREAELSGPTHNKGVYILSGYLRSNYAQNKPLVMSASVAFEQSYGGVDGDSASSAEIYAILSSLAGIPLRQDIAVTGSVNQRGEIQPIGGINEKIEGFFDICKARGLTSKHGVLIPFQNIGDLMLRHDVIEEIKKGKFHVYAIKTIDEGIELLTGIPGGKKLKNGEYPKGTIHHLVDKRLTEFAKCWKEIETDEKE